MAGEDLSLRKMINFLAFIGVIACAISLFLSIIPGLNVWFGRISSTISLIVMAFSGYFFAASKRNGAYMITYWVAIALILVFTIWGWFWL